jgi:hypothetical protein
MSSNLELPSSEIQALAQLLAATRAGEPPRALLAHARAMPGLRGALPEKFFHVLDPILDRLESGALFSEESCSFSQRDLLDAIEAWSEKAKNRLQNPVV